MSFAKTITAAAAGLIFLFQCSAQAQGNYVQVSAGYNFANLSGFSNKGHAKGFTPGATIGRMFYDQFGAELGVGYLWGTKHSEKSSFQRFNGYPDGYVTMNTSTTKYSRMLLIQPAVVLQTTNAGTKIYIKGGPVIGIGKMHEIYKEEGDGSPLERHLEFRGSAALGLQSTVGVIFNGNAKTAFFAEANTRMLWYSPTNGEVLKLLINGKDRTADMSVRGREVVFVNNPSNSYGNYDSPTQAKRETQSCHSAGINIGIRFNF